MGTLMLRAPTQPPTSKMAKSTKSTKRPVEQETKDYLLDHLECALLMSMQRRLRLTAYLVNLSIESIGEKAT